MDFELKAKVSAYLERVGIEPYEDSKLIRENVWIIMGGVRADSCFSEELPRKNMGLFHGRFIDVLIYAIKENLLKSDWTTDISDNKSGHINKQLIKDVPVQNA